MIARRVRRLAAQALTGGQLDRISDEVQQALMGAPITAPTHLIEAIVGHAVAQVPFYREFRDSAFDDLPIVNKITMRKQPDAFIAAGLDRSKLAAVSTSGSTGIPFTAYFDSGKVSRHRGCVAGTDRYVGVDPFGPIVHARAWGMLPPRQRAALAIKAQLPYAGEQDDITVRRIARWLKNRRGASILGYSSYVERLLRGFEVSSVAFPDGCVRAVVGGSEPASDYLAEASGRLFAVVPHMRYSNMENGMIAVTGASIDEYRLDASSFHIEILKEDSDHPAEPGEVGRIVLTDLFNRAMPFIRYDTGDMGRFAVDEWGGIVPNVLTSITGRRLDPLIAGTEGAPTRAHALKVWGPAAKLTDLHQFQLRQNSIGHFTWVLNAGRSSALENRLRLILEEQIGDIVSCNFVYTDEVPVMASGKRKFFVQEIPDTDALLTRGLERFNG